MALFQPAKIGDIEVKNRFIMAPLTRCRATPRTHVPTPIMVEYYEQRATAGLIIAEATMVGDGQSAFWAEPGIYNEAQVEGWKPVTEAVHAKGGKIILQIWHGGRACHHLNGPNEDPAQNPQPVAPSAVAVTGHQIGAEFNPTGAKVDYDTPRALTEEEIPSIIAAYVRGAQNAIAAGFDGVEIHGANGYLIDEFLRDSANQRPDGRYSGKSIETRAQFALDVAAAVAAAIGAGKVGIRISPINSYNGMVDSNPEALTRYLCAKLSELNLAFLHVMRSDFFKAQQGDAQGWARESYKGFLIANMGYKADEANETIEAGKTDAIAFGVSFIANPDLVERVQKGAPLNPPDFATFYQGGVKGYTDYPMLQALA